MQSGIKTDRYFVCNSQDKLRICGSYIRGTCAKMKHKRGNNDTNGPKRPQASQLQKKILLREAFPQQFQQQRDIQFLPVHFCQEYFSKCLQYDCVSLLYTVLNFLQSLNTFTDFARYARSIQSCKKHSKIQYVTHIGSTSVS